MKNLLQCSDASPELDAVPVSAPPQQPSSGYPSPYPSPPAVDEAPPLIAAVESIYNTIQEHNDNNNNNNNNND